MKSGVSEFPKYEKLKVWLENSVLAVFGVLLAASIYFLNNDLFWLQFISEINTDLSPIAKVESSQGMVKQRTRLDTLWLPSYSQKTVFDGDLVSTGADASSEIVLTEKAKIYVEPESLVRLKKLNGKPLIRISQGQIKAVISDDQTVYIKKGFQIEEVVLRKGTYFIKNDQSAGIQITSFEQETKKTSGIPEPSKAKMKAEDSESEDTKPISQENSKPHQFKAPTGINYTLPTPKTGTIFLIKAVTEITIAHESECQNSCTLTVYQGNQIVQNISYSKGQSSFFQLKISPEKEGLFRWQYQNDAGIFSGEFDVLKLSPESLEKAMLSGKPVEII